jgi:hypothetical protein
MPASYRSTMVERNGWRGTRVFTGMRNRQTSSAILAIACAAMLAAGAASAASTSPGDAVPTPPNDEKGVRPSEGSSVPRGDLSDQLSRTGGVIKPPTDVDPAMHQPAPDPGPQSTPVIPPPGTAPNSLDVKPK